jgi:cytochrome c
MHRNEWVPAKAACLAAICSVGLVMFAAPQVSSIGGNQAGDAERGKTLFEKRCTGCHGLDQDKEGPRLRNVYGRRAGSVASFQYSNALKTTHITWTDASLDQWLTNTESVIPGNEMSFHVPKAEERADIIRFLQVSSGR